MNLGVLFIYRPLRRIFAADEKAHSLHLVTVRQPSYTVLFYRIVRVGQPRADLTDVPTAARSLEREERYVVQAVILGTGHSGREYLDDEHFGEELDTGRQQMARMRDG
jgi:hypothetical protein